MQNVKLRRASWWLLFFAAAFLIFDFHPKIYAETHNLEEDYSQYRKALEDTKETTQAKIFTGLLAVVPMPDVTNYLRLYGDEIRWNREGEIEGIKAKTRVLVVAFVKMTDWTNYYWPNLHKEYQVPVSLWVTVVPEMKNFMVGKECPPTQERIVQVLGLHPINSPYEVLVEMWVDPALLFRPSPDPEITDHQAEQATRVGESIFWEYPSDHNAFLTLDNSVFFLESAWSVLGKMTFQEWYENRTATIYNTVGDAQTWGWPWTRLGYTYDWGNKDNHVGLSEFVVRIDPDKKTAPVIPQNGVIYGTADWDAYFRCGPKAPMLAMSTSATGVTLIWSKDPGADGYYLLYKQVERGTRFEPPFEESNKIDVGNVNSLDVTLGSGACFYVAVQSYNLKGPGGISNIEYFYIP